MRVERNAGERLTFLGARRDEPCEERTDELSSVMAGVVQAVLQRQAWMWSGRANGRVVCSRGRRGRGRGESGEVQDGGHVTNAVAKVEPNARRAGLRDVRACESCESCETTHDVTFA